MKKNINPIQLTKSIVQKFFGKRETKQSVVFDIAEIGLKLDQCKCYPWGENLLRVIDEEGNGYLVNQLTRKARWINTPSYVVCFSDEEIDFATLDRIPLSHNAHSRRIDYRGIGRWDDCQKGIFALSWMLYPDGRYFADSDGFGGEDNEELIVYCLMNDNLEVIHPFTVVRDVAALLTEIRNTQ